MIVPKTPLLNLNLNHILEYMMVMFHLTDQSLLTKNGGKKHLTVIKKT